MTAAILHENLADLAVLTVSSNIAAAPASMMQNPHTTRRWIGSNGSSEYILAVFDTVDFAFQTIDTIGLFKCAGVFDGTLRDLSSAAVTRVRLSSADLTGDAGDLLDTGSLSGQISYGALVKLLDSPVSAVALKIDLTEGGASILEAGRLVIGVRSSFETNFQYGWSFGFSDLSRLRKSAGGQTFVDLDERYRVLSVNFSMLTQAERLGFVQDLDRLNGVSTDVLFVTDTDSADLGRDSVWGLVESMTPVTQPHFDLFAKTYAISERL